MGNVLPTTSSGTPSPQQIPMTVSTVKAQRSRLSHALPVDVQFFPLCAAIKMSLLELPSLCPLGVQLWKNGCATTLIQRQADRGAPGLGRLHWGPCPGRGPGLHRGAGTGSLVPRGPQSDHGGLGLDWGESPTPHAHWPGLVHIFWMCTQENVDSENMAVKLVLLIFIKMFWA